MSSIEKKVIVGLDSLTDLLFTFIKNILLLLE